MNLLKLLQSTFMEITWTLIEGLKDLNFVTYRKVIITAKSHVILLLYGLLAVNTEIACGVYYTGPKAQGLSEGIQYLIRFAISYAAQVNATNYSDPTAAAKMQKDITVMATRTFIYSQPLYNHIL